MSTATTFVSTNAIWNFGTTGGFYSKYGNQTVYFGALAGAGGSTLSGGSSSPTTYVVGNLNSNTLFGGIISDGSVATDFRKVGTGVLILTNANTYTGSTIISNGTVEVDGSLGYTLTTNYTGATLAGTGTLSGAVDIEAGSTLLRAWRALAITAR